MADDTDNRPDLIQSVHKLLSAQSECFFGMIVRKNAPADKKFSIIMDADPEQFKKLLRHTMKARPDVADAIVQVAMEYVELTGTGAVIKISAKEMEIINKLKDESGT